MNKDFIEMLEKHFDTASAAPDGVKKLRELILTLAVQGKLVPQDPNDQPASELLHEIEAQKQRLAQAGEIKNPKSLPEITKDKQPYSLPHGWEWVRLGNIGIINPRNNADDDKLAGFVPMPFIQEGYSEFHSFEERPWGEIKKGYTHFADGDVGMAKITPCFENAKSCVFSNLPSGIGAGTTELHIFRNAFRAVDPRYLLFFLKNPKFISATAARMTGSAGQKRVPTPLFAELELPLPPISEQHRIVAKIDELMARCNELEELRTSQQGARLAVHAATIKHLLNIAEPDQHQRAQAFLAGHFGELYTVKENVAELRKAILQLAVMGKLVPQNPNDQPASELLQEIEFEKRRLVQEGKIKVSRSLPTLSKEEMPYVLPQGWKWARLGEITDIIRGITFPASEKTKEPASGRIACLRTANVQKKIEWGDLLYIDRTFMSKKSQLLRQHDIVMSMANSRELVGKVAVVSEIPVEEATFGGFLGVLRTHRVAPLYVFHLLNTSYARSSLIDAASQTTNIANISLAKLNSFFVPVPPISEQHRIVAKIDELMILCESLDQQIDAATCKKAALLNALISAESQSHIAKKPQRGSSSKAQVIELAAYRASIGCYTFSKLSNVKYFGRTAAAKLMYLAQAHVGLALDLMPERQAAGPLDTWIYDFERQGETNGWFEHTEKTLTGGRKKTEYRCLPAILEEAKRAELLMSPAQKAKFDHLIYALAGKKTEEVEIIATLFAVWNDFLIEGIHPTDKLIISDLRENWHERKARFTSDELGRWLAWLRAQNIVPEGLSPRTVQQAKLHLN
ncbi:restriction endonuclease subunit S [Stenotrophomonas geniculata]|uniref:restriction endonuclease subunit S n=1 Tax=Stenotrophomonas geniculata TaxID=86188 RepID=UPI00370B6E90